jgi:hypothetical protein
MAAFLETWWQNSPVTKSRGEVQVQTHRFGSDSLDHWAGPAVYRVGQERARVGWAAMTASHTPLWVAQEKGVFGETRFVGGIDLFWRRSTGNAGSRGRRSGYRCHLGA